ncbi:MAG: hypothetical protein IJR32_00175 [Paludibacteraceae bacterium]|nr:hypothetical protein [Paludibacteraceae bacterium]
MKKHIFTFIAFVLAIIAAQAKDIVVTDITADQIPSEVKYKGDIYAAVTWKDKQGTHFVIETQTKPLMTKSAKAAQQREEEDNIVDANGNTEPIAYLDADYRIKGLFTYHYVQNKKDGLVLVFKHIDFIDQCTEQNLHANYLTKPVITDLNDDKNAEVWIVYALGCRQFDATPLAMRMIVYMGNQRAQVNGLQLVYRKDGKTNGGESRMDENFQQLPQPIKDFGKRLWMENVNQK